MKDHMEQSASDRGLFSLKTRRQFVQLSVATAGLAPSVVAGKNLRLAYQESGDDVRPSEAAEGKDAVLNFGGIQEPMTLDPHLTTSETDKTVLNLYDRLVDTDPITGELVGELATEWNVSEDGLTVTFMLRDGVKFQDGTDFNAEAAKINFERCIALRSNIVEAFDVIDSIQVIDNLTLEVKLKNPMAAWIPMLTQNPKMVSPTAIADHAEGDDMAQAWLAENTAGTGAYRHIRWDHGANLYWEAFPEHWRGWEGRHLTEINYRIMLEAGTQRLQLENGDIDVATVYTQDSIPSLQANPDINVMTSSQPNILYIRLNNFTGPTSDRRVREAISYGFDYDAYTTLLNIDPAPPRSDMPVPVQLFGSEFEGRGLDIPYFTYDPEKAKSLLEEAGYGDGFRMNIYTDASSPQKPLLAETFQAYMSALNIQVDIVVETFANILALGTDQEKQKNWDTAIHSWVLFTPPQYPDPSAFLLRMYNPYPNSVRNLLGYVNEEVQSLTREGLQQTDRLQAMEYYWQANEIIVADCPDLILDRATQFEMLRTYVKGHRQHVFIPWLWRFWNNWIERD